MGTEKERAVKRNLRVMLNPAVNPLWRGPLFRAHHSAGRGCALQRQCLWHRRDRPAQLDASQLVGRLTPAFVSVSSQNQLSWKKNL